MLGFWGGDEEDEGWEGDEDEDDDEDGGGPFNMITANNLEGSSEDDYYGEDYDLQKPVICACVYQIYLSKE